VQNRLISYKTIHNTLYHCSTFKIFRTAKFHINKSTYFYTTALHLLICRQAIIRNNQSTKIYITAVYLPKFRTVKIHNNQSTKIYITAIHLLMCRSANILTNIPQNFIYLKYIYGCVEPPNFITTHTQTVIPLQNIF